MFSPGNIIKKTVLFFALVLMAAYAPNVSANQNFRIMFKKAVCVESDYVLLGDIAEPIGQFEDNFWTNLANIRLFRGPGPNSRPIVVPQKGLKIVLRKALGPYAANCVVPDKIIVQRGGKVMSEQELETRIVNFLTPQLKDMGRLEFVKFHIPDYLLFPDKFDELVLESGDTPAPGRNMIRIKVVGASGNNIRQIAGTVFVNVWAPVPCAARPVNPTEPLAPRLVTYVNKNLAYLNGDPWDGTGGPWRVKRPVGTNQVIYLSNLDSLPAVQKGDKVYLTFKGKFVHLTVPAEALGDGKIGEMITVRNMQSDRKILAMVVDTNTVRVR